MIFSRAHHLSMDAAMTRCSMLSTLVQCFCLASAVSICCSAVTSSDVIGTQKRQLIETCSIYDASTRPDAPCEKAYIENNVFDLTRVDVRRCTSARGSSHQRASTRVDVRSGKAPLVVFILYFITW